MMTTAGDEVWQGGLTPAAQTTTRYSGLFQGNRSLLSCLTVRLCEDQLRELKLCILAGAMSIFNGDNTGYGQDWDSARDMLVCEPKTEPEPEQKIDGAVLQENQKLRQEIEDLKAQVPKERLRVGVKLCSTGYYVVVEGGSYILAHLDTAELAYQWVKDHGFEMMK